MRVSFRWPKGTLGFRMKTQGARFIDARAHRDAGRHDLGGRARRQEPALQRPPHQGHGAQEAARAAARGAPAGCRPRSPAAACGSGSCPRARAANVAAIAARAQAAGISTVFVKSSDGPTSRWAQFNGVLVQNLHAYGLRACAWQYVYGQDPLGEAQLGADAVAGRRGLPGDRRREGVRGPLRAGAAVHDGAARGRRRRPTRSASRASRTSTTTRRCRTRSSSARAARRRTCRRSTGRRSAARWTPSAPTRWPTTASTAIADRAARPGLRQPARRRTCARFRASGRATARPACRGGRWQSTAQPTWDALAAPAPVPVALARSGLAAAGQGQQGRSGGVAAAAPEVVRPGDRRSTARFGAATDAALRRFQAAERPAGDRDDRRRHLAGRPGSWRSSPWSGRPSKRHLIAGPREEEDRARMDDQFEAGYQAGVTGALPRPPAGAPPRGAPPAEAVALRAAS